MRGESPSVDRQHHPVRRQTQHTIARGFNMRSSFGRAILLVLALFAAATGPARAQAPDTVLVNGKIVTVDDRFTIAQALAIKGERILKVGTTAEVEALRGPQTRVIDLAGRTVIPGLIDNHAHWVRAAEHDEVTRQEDAVIHARENLTGDRQAEPQPVAESAPAQHAVKGPERQRDPLGLL